MAQLMGSRHSCGAADGKQPQLQLSASGHKLKAFCLHAISEDIFRHILYKLRHGVTPQLQLCLPVP